MQTRSKTTSARPKKAKGIAPTDFKSVARALECNDDEVAFDAALKRIGKVVSSPKTKGHAK